MEKIDKLALVAVVLLIISRFVSVFSGPLLSLVYDEAATDIYYLSKVYAAVSIPFTLLINIALGIWLYKEAKKDKSTPWVWCLFGFFFSLTGVAVFYLVRIYKIISNKNDSEPAV